jgi:cytochrome o ubiquinol oxidase subunit III
METNLPHGHHDSDKVIFGFWVYLMTDLIMFAVLFATYAVLHENTFGGPGGEQLFDLPFVLAETLILLTSSFTCGLGMLALHAEKKNQVLAWFTVTFLLGASFLTLELTEFHRLAADGQHPQNNAFLSSFFALVGMHGLHIAAGLLWILVMLIYVLRRGLNPSAMRKFNTLSLFWHFLDVIWIFIFTIVYLMGKI